MNCIQYECNQTNICWDCSGNLFQNRQTVIYIILGITGIPGPLMKDRPVLVTNTSSLPSGGSTLPGNEASKFAALFLKIGLLIVPQKEFSSWNQHLIFLIKLAVCLRGFCVDESKPSKLLRCLGFYFNKLLEAHVFPFQIPEQVVCVYCLYRNT